MWTRQLGTRSYETSYDVSADVQGNVYISGSTEGSLGGPNTGKEDAFVSKLDTQGKLVWTSQLGTSSEDVCFGVSPDGLGNVYISGSTKGSLGGPNAGDRDAFVSKFDSQGNLLWTQQMGTSSWDESSSVLVDGRGNVYISGRTFGSLSGPNAGSMDAFVSKFDPQGKLLWTRQFGTPGSDASLDISADGPGNVYISGRTKGSLGGPNGGDWDAFVSKFDPQGNLLWTRQLGTSPTFAVRR